MSLLQTAYRTYEHYSKSAGVIKVDEEPLAPVAHIIQNAQIEVTIDENGHFLDAKAVPKEQSKTLIPVTEASANRTSGYKAHPLCDQICYVTSHDSDKYNDYIDQLSMWAQSSYSHPKVRAILHYVQQGTMLSDLNATEILTLNEQGQLEKGKIEGTEYAKCMVRWRVMPPPDNTSSASWEDTTLFEAFINYYNHQCAEKRKDVCIISGQVDTVTENHPKGILSGNFGAKLICANDNTGFTYRGRFMHANESGSIGYSSSQKAHSALHWLVANQGVYMNGRVFLCWNPDGKSLPTLDFLRSTPSTDEKHDMVSYKNQLHQSLKGYRNGLSNQDDVAITALEAATTGRLSITYYNEMRATDFLDRVQNWYDSCCWDSKSYGVQSPPIQRIVTCAWGVERENFIEADERAVKEHVQQLLTCVVDCRPVPVDVVCALAQKASQPLAYKKPGNREMLLCTACAVLRKYHNDKKHKEEWKLALDENNNNRSYLYGRLLAVAEQVERSTYHFGEEGRDPNAIRMQSVFSQRPQYAWRILEEALVPYYKRLQPGLRQYFRSIVQEIIEKFSPDDADLNKKLEDVYLLGYYHQKTALTRKKNNNIMEETDNEYSE